MNHDRRAFTRRIADATHAAARVLPLWRRPELLLLAVLVIFIFLFVGPCTGAVILGNQLRLFSPPSIQPLTDERILTNVYDKLPVNAILAAETHQGKIYLAQENGLIHDYDPATHLWNTQPPFSTNTGITSDFRLLHSDQGSLWGLSTDGGLARLVDRWETVVTATGFLDASGQPIEDSDLTTAAIDTSETWLLLGTRGKGIGLYNIPEHAWSVTVPVPGDVLKAVWWQDYFWAATTQGLFRLRPGANGRLIESVTGQIIDLDADPNGLLWVLTRHDCESGGEGCIWLATFANSNVTPQPLIDERNHFSGVNLGNLNFAQQSGNLLILAGEAGIYTYDMQLHSWERLSNSRIFTTLSYANGEGFYFADAQGIGQVTHGVLGKTWALDESVAKLLYGDNTDELLALTRQGNLYTLIPSQDTVQQVYRQGKTTFDPTHFTSALALGDITLLISPNGLLLQDVRRRTYEDVTRSNMSGWEWLLSQDTKLFTSGGDVYALTSGGTVYTMSANEMTTASSFLSGGPLRQQYLSNAVASAWQWGDIGMGILSDNGSVSHIGPAATDEMIGIAQPSLAGARLQDVAAYDNIFAGIFNGALWRYSLDDRTWSDVNIDTHAGENLEELATANNQLLMRTNQGRLLDASGNPIIGGDAVFNVTDSNLSDALLEDNQLYLGGGGRVDLYDFDERTVINTWHVANGGDVRLMGVLDGLPLSWAGTQAVLGDRPLEGGAGDVTGLSYDSGYIWTVRRSANTDLYLMGHNRQQPYDSELTQCYFRQQTAGFTQVRDARALPNNGIAVLTDGGLKFYSLSARTWYDAPASIPAADRLYYLHSPTGDDLLLLVSNLHNIKLTFLSVADIEMPPSCSTGTATAPVKRKEEARSYTVDEASGKTAWITLDGSIIEWDGSTEVNEIQREAKAVGPGDLRRVFNRQADGYLLFTTATQLWRYTLAARTWDEIVLHFPTSGVTVADITVEQAGSDNIVTVRSNDGRYYYGTLDADFTVDLKLIIDTGDLQSANLQADNLLDVQQHVDEKGLWTFVFSDRILYFNPLTRAWRETDFTASPPDTSLLFVKALGRGVIVGENGATWWVADKTGDHPDSFTHYSLTPTDIQVALTSARVIWRLSNSGELFECSPQDKEYACNLQHSPFTLDPTSVQHAFEVSNLILFELTNGMRAFDKNLGEEVTLTPKTANFNAVSATFAPGSELLLLYSDTNDSVLYISPDGITTFDAVSDFIIDDLNTLWVRMDGAWYHFDGNTFSLPRTADGRTADEANIRLMVLPSMPVTGIDPAGVPYLWDGTQLVSADAALPTPADSVKWMLPTVSGHWWVQTGDNLTYFAAEVCVSPEQPYPVSTLDYLPTNPTLVPTLDTALPTPSPTSTPTRVSCFYPLGTAQPPPGEIVRTRVVTDTLELIDINGQGTRLRPIALNQFEITSFQEAVSAPALSDRWGDLSQNLRQLPNGAFAYDPFLQLVVSTDGELDVLRPTSTRILADSGVLPAGFVLPDALNAGWLRWNRERHMFDVNTNSGQTSFTPNNFIADGVFLFEPINALLVTGGQTFRSANLSGLWLYTTPALKLNDPNIVFTPTQLTLPIDAAHGYFLSDGDMLHMDGNNLLTVPLSDERFNVGDVNFIEKINIPRVEVTYSADGNTLSGLDGTTFVWDVNRRALAYGNDLMLQSDAGIQPLDGSYTGFDLGPSQLALSSGVLQSDGGKGVYLHNESSNEWYRLNNNSWQANVPDPNANRTVVQNSTWNWSFQNGSLDVALASNAFHFSINAAGSFGFNADHLLAASSYNGSLYAATDAFLEVASPASQLSGLLAPRLDPIATNRLDNFRFADGTSTLFSFDAASVTQLDTSGQFVTSPTDPTVNRSLAAMSRLRFNWDNGEVVKEVSVDDFKGGTSWVGFDFFDGRFPFDYVTGITFFDQTLNLGTKAGLETYPDVFLQSLPLGNISNLYDVRSQSNDALTEVSNLGITVNDPDLLFASSSAVCIERRPAQNFSPCADRQPGDKLRVANDLWHWKITAQGTVEGHYYEQSGSLDAERINLSGGRLPHDRIQAVTVCQNRAFTIWNSRWVTAYPGLLLQLDAGIENIVFNDAQPQRFLCVPTDTILGAFRLPAGTYLQDNTGDWWVQGTNNWSLITRSEMSAALREYTVAPPLYMGGRLRLRANQKHIEFEHLSSLNTWLPVPWLRDPITQNWMVGIDDWREIVYHDNRTWVATPLGLIDVARAPDGIVQLDPVTLELLREPLLDYQVCAITNLMSRDNQMIARCADGEVFNGDLTQTPLVGVFTRQSDDPFAEADLITADPSGGWSWSLIGRVGSAPGSLELKLRDERMNLVGGQFDFDALTSIALFRDDLVELASERAGWLQAPRNTALAVSVLERPAQIDNPARFTSVDVTHNGNISLLCLTAGSNDFVGLDSQFNLQRPRSCPEWAGSDQLWLYLQDNDGLKITALAGIGGDAERSLLSGRFTDDIVTGLPITGTRGGETVHWLPTRAGILQMHADFRPFSLYVGRFEGLEEKSPPTLLYLYDGRTPSYMGFTGGVRLYQLEGNRVPLTGSLWAAVNAVGAVQVRDLVGVREGWLRILWADETGNRWSDVNLEERQQIDDLLSTDVDNFSAYYLNQSRLQDIQPRITASYAPGRFTFTLGNLDPYIVDLPADFQLVEAVIAGDRLLVIGTHDMRDISLDTILYEIARK